MQDFLTKYVDKLRNWFCPKTENKPQIRDNSNAIAELINSAIWAVGYVIDLTFDILEWINNKLEELIDVGTLEINVTQGDALSDFILKNQINGKYNEISSSDLDILHNSVVNVAMDKYGNITDDQMIRSNGGLSTHLRTRFNGQPILKIQIHI